MAYSKTTWVDNSAPSLDAAHLNNIENGVEDLDIRLTSAESSLSTAEANITTNEGNIQTLTTDLNTVENKLANATIIRTGTFSGSWTPTLNTTFGVTNYTDYDWVINLHQTSRTTTNGHIVTLDGFLDVDGVTLNFTSTDNSTAVEARYTLTGYLKEYSNYSSINQ